MKEKITPIVDAVGIALIVPSVLMCLVTSFELTVNTGAIFVFSFIFTAIIATVFTLTKSKKVLISLLLASGFAFVIFILMFLPRLTGQFEYTLNTVLKSYSQYLAVPTYTPIGGSLEMQATLLFVTLEFFLIMIFSLFIFKARIFIPVVTLSILLLVPCFILVNTVPNLFFLFTSISILFTFFITSNIHRHNNGQSGIIAIISTVSIFALLLCIYAFNPIDGYKRYDWQDNLLIYAQDLTGISSGEGNTELIKRKQKLGNSIEKEVDLSDAGPLKQTGELVMQIEHAGYGEDRMLYLRGTAYANYKDNKWEILTSKQLKAYPQNFNAFNMNSSYGNAMLLDIKTVGTSNIVYTPYYLTYTPVYVNPLGDIYIPNDSRKNSYTLSYKPYTNTEEIIYDTKEYYQYRHFVYDNYMGISDKLKNELIKIGEQNGIDYAPLDSRRVGTVSNELLQMTLVEEIKTLVSNSAEYSLNSTGVPDEKEIPVWLLTEAESAYCVHFATTAAMMLRAYDIPARYVTGYYVKKHYDAEDPNNKTDVTTDNAHAWVEYFSDQYGWIPIEATPSSFEPQTPATPFPAIQNEITPDATSHFTTAPTTEPITQAETTPQQINNYDFDYLAVPIIALCIIILLLIALIARMKILIALRTRHFYSGRKNERAIYLYRYIKMCRRYLKSPLSDKVETLGAKAKFSKHIISDEELKILISEADYSKSEIYKDCNAVKKLFYKIIIVI